MHSSILLLADLLALFCIVTESNFEYKGALLNTYIG